MKLITIKQLRKREAEELESSKNGSKFKFIKQKYLILNLYLERNPSVEYITDEISRLKNMIEIYESRFDGWKQLNFKTFGDLTDSQIKSKYNEKFGVSAAKIQIRNLSELLV